MKKTLLTIVIIGLVGGLFLFHFANKDTQNTNSPSDSIIQIEKGFVFYYGKYIETPYTVSIDKNSILINNNVVFFLRPVPKIEMPVDTGDPGVPSWVDENTTLPKLMEDGNGRIGLAFKKWYYLTRTNSPRDAIYKMIAYMNSLPCISKVELDTPMNDNYHALLIITSKKGKEMGLHFTAPPQKKNTEKINNNSIAKAPTSIPNDPDKQSQLNDRRKNIIRALESNQALFYFRDTGPSMGFGSKIFVKRFPLAIDILKSSATQEEKITKLKDLGFELGTKMLVDKFEESKQLNERLAELSKETNVMPMTMEDLQAEIKAKEELLKPKTQPAR